MKRAKLTHRIFQNRPGNNGGNLKISFVQKIFSLFNEIVKHLRPYRISHIE